MSKEPKKFHPSDGGIVSQPIWMQSHLQKVVVLGKIMGRKTLLEKIKFSSVFGITKVWFMSSCKMLLTGCFEWSNGIWKNAFMEEISNKLCSPHAPQVQNFLWKHQLLSFSLHFAFYRVFPNHKGFQSNDHLGYIAPIMPHRSNIKYFFVQPSSSLKNKPNKNLMAMSRRVLQQFTLRAFLSRESIKFILSMFPNRAALVIRYPGKLIQRNFGFGACRQRPF